MNAKSLNDEKRNLFKYYAGVIMGPMKVIESFNYVLPSSCMFPLPSVTQANIHSFSVGAGKEVNAQVSLLLYIFYTMPRDALQVEQREGIECSCTRHRNCISATSCSTS